MTRGSLSATDATAEGGLMSSEVVEVPITRWSCHKGHFIAADSVTSEDRIDPGAYYGVSSTIQANCKVCGLIDNPHIVEIGTQQVEIPEPRYLGTLDELERHD